MGACVIVALIATFLSMDRTILGVYLFERAFFAVALLSLFFGDGVISFDEIPIMGFTPLNLSVAIALMWDLLWITRLPLGGILQPKVTLPAVFSYYFLKTFGSHVEASVLGFSFIPGILIAYLVSGAESAIFFVIGKLSSRVFSGNSLSGFSKENKLDLVLDSSLPYLLVALRFAVMFLLSLASLLMIPYVSRLYSVIPEELRSFFALIMPSVVVFSLSRLGFLAFKSSITLKSSMRGL